MILSISLIYVYEYIYSLRVSRVHNYLNNKIYYEQILNNIVIRNTLKLGGLLSNYIDNGLLRTLGSTGVSRGIYYINIIILINILYIFITVTCNLT